MLEKFNRLAEQAATTVSRRQFFGRFGRGAIVAAAAVGGMMAATRNATAARPGEHGCSVGDYQCADGSTFRMFFRQKCPKKHNGCQLVSCYFDPRC